jgi:hypothetical protein
MIPNTENLIKWFWAAAEKQFGVLRGNNFCQCGTERIIHDSGNPPLARAFLLASVSVDQAMWHNPFCDYKAFARQFRFPQLEAHGGEGNVSAKWVVYSYHGWDKKMDWPLGASVFCQLADDLRKWLLKLTWGEAAFRHFSERAESLVRLFAEYNKEASRSILRSLQHGETRQPLWTITELRERPDLVTHLLKLVSPGRQRDSLVSDGIQITTEKHDGLLGLELMKAEGPDTKRGNKLLDILLQIVTEREDPGLAIRVAQYLSHRHVMRNQFIEFIAKNVRSGRNGSFALQLYNLSIEGNLYRNEALIIALEAAINTCNPDLLYGVARIVGKEHSSYPDIIGRLVASFWEQPSQSAFENLMKVLGEDHPEFNSVLEFANKCMLRLSEEHQRRRKAEAARERKIMHQQRQLLQKEKSNQRHDHLASMAQWRPVERLEYLARLCDRSLTYYPADWANVDDGDIALLDDDLRKALIERLRMVRKGPWRKLKARLQRTST